MRNGIVRSIGLAVTLVVDVASSSVVSLILVAAPLLLFGGAVFVLGDPAPPRTTSERAVVEVDGIIAAQHVLFNATGKYQSALGKSSYAHRDGVRLLAMIPNEHGYLVAVADSADESLQCFARLDRRASPAPKRWCSREAYSR